MAINAIPPLPPPALEPSATSGTLDKDGFLRLLVGQLRQQDPMNAQGTEQLMAQMTQLSMLEQVTNLTKVNEQLAARMETSQALDLIGRNVSYKRVDGTTAEGVVTKAVILDGVVSLTIGADEGIDPSEVSEIR
jgi:flagellar basal-body rod modification protein FlgD